MTQSSRGTVGWYLRAIRPRAALAARHVQSSEVYIIGVISPHCWSCTVASCAAYVCLVL